MFGFLKRDPAAKLRAQYAKLMKEATDLQRKGDIEGFAAKSAEAAEVENRIEALEKQN